MAESTISCKKPTSAFSLYVQLYYSKRNGLTECNSSFTEATKSWLTLSKEDREIFHRKYNVYRENVRKSYADNLKNVVPFMKHKKQRNLPMNHCLQNELQTQSTSLHTSLVPQDDPSNLDETQMEHNNTDDDLQSKHEESEKDLWEKSYLPQIRLHEPILPTIRTAKDLFDVVSTLDDTCTNSNWESLSMIQKRRYQSAALTLKKDYIHKYKKYLESLSSQELFGHYCSKASE